MFAYLWAFGFFKSCIQATLNLSKCAESSNNTKKDKKENLKKNIIKNVIGHMSGVKVCVSHVSPVTCHQPTKIIETTTFFLEVLQY